MTPSSISNSQPDTRAWHTLEVDQTLSALDSDRDRGLTTEQVQERRERYGSNELEETGGRSAWQILLDQFTNIMLLMLIAVALISGVLDIVSMQSGNLKPGEIPFKDTIAILTIVVLNGVLGYLQESRAEQALAALKKLSSPRVRLLRDRKLLEVASKDSSAWGYHATRSRSTNCCRWSLNRRI